MKEIAAMTREIVERAKRYESDTVPGDFVTLHAVPEVRRRGEGELQEVRLPGCDWSTWKIVAGRQFEYDEIETLLRRARSARCSASATRWGGLFNADDRAQRGQAARPSTSASPRKARKPRPVDFSDQQPVGACPKCASRVFEHGMAYVCEKSVGPGKSCDFRSGKIILQQPIEREQMPNC
jgi:DNA topoisomerase-3